MPRYFAYGSNMDRQAMALRCPRSSVIGPAVLRGHSLVILPEGYASVVRNRTSVVYGLLWDLALCDVATLDAYENISGGLYKKIQQPVSLLSGGRAQALIYIGNSAGGGVPKDAYLDRIVTQCERLNFPPAYINSVRNLAHGLASSGDAAGRSNRSMATRRPQKEDVRALRDSDGNIVVRPRFSNPVNRG